MNRSKKEQLKHHTPEDIEQIEIKQKVQRAADAKNFPELFDFMRDSIVEAEDRARGISPITKEERERIRIRLEKGEYPERLVPLALAELNLKER